MHITHRTQAITQAQQALKQIENQRNSTRAELGRARELVNSCYRLRDGGAVWAAVAEVEELAAAGSRGAGAPAESSEPSPSWGDGLIAAAGGSQDVLDEVVEAVSRRHPDLTGEAFNRKVRRVLAIQQHAQDGPAWSVGREES